MSSSDPTASGWPASATRQAARDEGQRPQAPRHGAHEVRWREAGGARRSRSFTRKGDADDFAALTDAACSWAASPRAPGRSPWVTSSSYWRTYAIPNLAPRSRDLYAAGPTLAGHGSAATRCAKSPRRWSTTCACSCTKRASATPDDHQGAGIPSGRHAPRRPAPAPHRQPCARSAEAAPVGLRARTRSRPTLSKRSCDAARATSTGCWSRCSPTSGCGPRKRPPSRSST